jgi:opacity protein-like surface antigen
MAGVGYGFSWGDLRLSYRYLYYEPGQDKLIKNISFHGLTIGATFQL